MDNCQDNNETPKPVIYKVNSSLQPINQIHFPGASAPSTVWTYKW
jgi:hypothetical protein